MNPAAAVKNLRQMEEYGWTGRYGFYEAVDYTRRRRRGDPLLDGAPPGHGLLAICNLLFDNPMQRYFHAEPQVLATELLLHERVPAAVVAEAKPPSAPEIQPI